MVERGEYIQKYWNYYVKLERDCTALSQYIDIREVNYKTCSNIIIGQLLNVGAEFDHFCKVVCGIDLGQRANISDYASYLLTNIDGLQNVKVHIQGTGEELFPFKDWNTTAPKELFWWKALW